MRNWPLSDKAVTPTSASQCSFAKATAKPRRGQKEKYGQQQALKEHDFGGLCQLGLLSGQDQIEGIEQGGEKNCYRAMHDFLGIFHKFKLAAHDEGNAHQACEGCPDGRAPYALAQQEWPQERVRAGVR